MIYWKIVDIPNYENTVKVLLEYQTTYKLFGLVDRFWNPTSERGLKLVRQTGILNNIESILGTIKEMALLSLPGDTSTLHIDHTYGKNNGVMARLNLPVSNCSGSYTAFFKLSDELMQNYGITPGGTKYWSDELRNTLEPVTSVELIQPTILRTSEPHTVFCRENNFPRVSLTMSFEQDLVRLLEN